MASSNETACQQYLEQMLWHGAYALYEPLRSSEFTPGSCGCFDNSGHWNKIVLDSTNTNEVSKAGFKPMSRIPNRMDDDDKIEWGPKVSRNVTARKINLQAGVEVPQFPVRVKTAFEYSTQSNVGAILTTLPPIRKSGFYHESAFVSFITENAQKLVEQYPELEKYGLWVVKVTFATKQCSNIVWSTAGKKVSIGFMASVAGVGGIGPSGEWYEEHGEEAWQKFRADGDEWRIPLFEGVKFSFSRKFITRSIGAKIAAQKSTKAARSEFNNENEPSILQINQDEALKVSWSTLKGLADDEDE